MSEMEEVKKLSPEEIQAMVEDMLVDISQEAQIKILTELVVTCIKAVQKAHESSMPGVITHTEAFLCSAIGELREQVKEHRL